MFLEHCINRVCRKLQQNVTRVFKLLLLNPGFTGLFTRNPERHYYFRT